MRVVVVADTHLVGEVRRRLPTALLRAMEGAELVLHAGDVVSATAWEELSAIAPLHGVLGNNDRELIGRLPERARLDLAGVSVGMVHDGGERTRRATRLAKAFASARLVVYGHSHVPDSSVGLDGQLLFNPGSPTQRRAQPHASYGVLELAEGVIVRAEIVEL